MSDNVRAHQERESIMTKTSRFNYIKRGLVGVCAATMLTGLCAGTAFGADSDNNTNVEVTTPSAQLSASVPTSVSVALKNDGTLNAKGDMNFTVTGPYQVVVKSVKAVKEDGFTISGQASMTAQNAVAAKIQVGSDASGAFEISGITETAKTFDTPGVIDPTSGLTCSITELVMKNMTAENENKAITPFHLVWTVGIPSATPAA